MGGMFFVGACEHQNELVASDFIVFLIIEGHTIFMKSVYKEKN